MLKIEKLNQYYGQSHTLWGETGPFVQWTNAAGRTPGRDAGPDRGDTDVSYATAQTGVRPC
jgi:hypothetical protein